MRHVPALDGLRAIAVLAVVAFHARQSSIGSGGFLGVDVFFVLSGYLITSILCSEFEKTGKVETYRFYWRRFLRLAPALLFYLTAYLAFAPSVWPEYGRTAHIRDAAIAATYFSDYAFALWGMPANLDHTWSLAVEEHFYLLWPLVLPAILRSRNPARLVLLLYLAGALWRGANLLHDWQLGYYRFDTRFAGILAGSWLALLLRQQPEILRQRIPTSAIWLAALTISAMALTQSWNELGAKTIAMPFVECATVLLILAIVQYQAEAKNGLLRMLEWQPLCRIGTLSYGIYLWHFPLARVLRDKLPFIQEFLLCLIISTVMAWISWHTVERLGRLAKDRVRVRGPLPA